PARDAHHVSRPVADGGDSMECTLDAGPVVGAEPPGAPEDVTQVIGGDHVSAEVLKAGRETGLGAAPQVQYDLDERRQIVPAHKVAFKPRRQYVQQLVKVVDDLLSLQRTRPQLELFRISVPYSSGPRRRG